MCKRVIYIIVALVLSLWGLVEASAQDAPDSTGVRLEATLVTCAPGTEAYEVYGHTALRLRRTDDARRDMVFNYGVFSFSEDNFIWRWTLGETDYSVEMLPYGVFCRWYGERGRAVNEQPLNLRQNELKRLADLALADAQAAHESGWTYRYNFFYDNCTTRVIDLIERCLAPGSRIEWPQAEEQTLRQMLHQYARPINPWLCEGQDLLIGTEVDKPAPMRSQLFSPIWASHYAAQAKVVRPDGSKELLVGGEEIRWEPNDSPDRLPVVLVVALMVLIVIAEIYLRFKRKTDWHWGVKALVHVLQGLIGIPVAILFFCSTHPAVDSNWLIVLLNPLWLIVAFLLRRGHRPGLIVSRCACALAAVGFLVGLLMGQVYPLVAYVLFLIMVVFSLRRLNEKK